jgi:UDP:flavonoid glycosyltransferase YjiC (YdhE family)
MLLPSIPPLDPLEMLPPDTFYVGPLIHQTVVNQPVPDWLQALENTRNPVVYVTVGGAAGIAGSIDFYRIVIDAFRNKDYQVVISTGGKAAPLPLLSAPPNVYITSWVPTREMLKRSDVVLFHGGYTRMEILMRGLPSIVIPFHSEQEYYGRIMAQLNMAVLLHLSDVPYRRLSLRWRRDKWFRPQRYTLYIRDRPTLEPDRIFQAVEKSLTDTTIQRCVDEINASLHNNQGSEYAIDQIQKKFNL